MATQLITLLGDTEPIDFEDARKHSRIIGQGDDQYLTTLIVAAREFCENQTSRAWVPARYKQTFSRFPLCGPIVLDRPPLVAVESIEYVDTAGATQALAAEDYEVSTVGDPGRIGLAVNKSWPSVRSDAIEPVTVTFTAGESEAPEKIKHAVRLLVAHWYEHREPVVMGKPPSSVPYSVESLLNAATLEVYR